VTSRPSRTLRSNSCQPTDHNPIVLHLNLLAKPDTLVLSNNATPLELPPRTQFHSSKLKDPAVRNLFSDALEDQARNPESAIQTLKISLEQGNINTTQYAEKANTIVVCTLQVTAERILGKTEFRGKCAQKERMAQRGQQDNGRHDYYSHDNLTLKSIAAKQTSTQTLKDKLQWRK